MICIKIKSRVYDIRNTSKALHVLGSNVGAIRSLHYSNDGQYLAAAGNIHIIHIILHIIKILDRTH